MIITRQEYQPASAQALFVQRVLSEWAEGQEVFAKTPTATDLQRKLIDTLDLARLERQVRFLIAALSWWYKPSDEERQRVPDRQQLDQAKHDLYRLIDELNGLARLLVEDEEIRRRVDQVFGRAVLVPQRAPPARSLRRRSLRRARRAAGPRPGHHRHAAGAHGRRARRGAGADHRRLDAVGPQRAAHPPPRLRLLGHHPLPHPGRERGQRARPRRGDAVQPAGVRAAGHHRRQAAQGCDAGPLRRLLQPGGAGERLPVGAPRHRGAADRAAGDAAGEVGGLVPEGRRDGRRQCAAAAALHRRLQGRRPRHRRVGAGRR